MYGAGGQASMMRLTLMRLVARLLIVTLLFPLLSSPVLAGDGTCAKNSRVCIEGPETRTAQRIPGSASRGRKRA